MKVEPKLEEVGGSVLFQDIPVLPVYVPELQRLFDELGGFWQSSRLACKETLGSVMSMFARATALGTRTWISLTDAELSQVISGIGDAQLVGFTLSDRHIRILDTANRTQKLRHLERALVAEEEREAKLIAKLNTLPPFDFAAVANDS